jgi:hypothetical protein
VSTERGLCGWCEQVRDISPSVAIVHLPELSAELKEQPAKERRPMMLCEACAVWHETQDKICPQIGSRFPTHNVVSYVDAARRGFFTYWNDDTRLDDDDIEALLEMYFEGIRTTIERVDYRGGRYGFDVTLEDFPMHTIMFSGEDPSQVRPEKQKIFVQTRDNFHADTMAPMLHAANALAVGLNVFVRQYATCFRRHLAKKLTWWRTEKLK